MSEYQELPTTPDKIMTPEEKMDNSTISYKKEDLLSRLTQSTIPIDHLSLRILNTLLSNLKKTNALINWVI